MAHEYMHSLSREEEEIINNMLRRWKRERSKECKIEFVDDLDLGFQIKAMEVIFEQQRELREDLEMEFNERNKGGYGR